jgi:hypothetical protein
MHRELKQFFQAELQEARQAETFGDLKKAFNHLERAQM